LIRIVERTFGDVGKSPQKFAFDATRGAKKDIMGAIMF
jgi:hypothetical protein